MSTILPADTARDVGDRRSAVAILPIGSFEQHGDFLPLATDTIIACAISGAIAEAYPVFALPPITVSCSHEHSAWPGTVSISARTLHSIVTEIYDSVIRDECSALVLINGHGGNYVLNNVVQEGSAAGKKIALFPTREVWANSRTHAHLETSMHEDMHAGEIETSILLHVAPESVLDGYQTADHMANDRRHLLTRGLHEYTVNGVIGCPSLATADKGKLVLASLVGDFADVIGLFG